MSYIKDTLSMNEKIILRRRRHIVVLLWPFVYNLAFLVALAYIASLASSENPDLFLPILAIGVIPVFLFFQHYLGWWTEEYFLTTHRVIRCQGFINKRVKDSSLEKVNDVMLSQSWVGRILNYGDIEILTASDIGVNRFKTMKSPVQFKTAMLDQKEALGDDEKHHGLAHDVSKGRVSDLISGLDKLRQEGAVTDKEFSDKKTQLLGEI